MESAIVETIAGQELSTPSQPSLIGFTKSPIGTGINPNNDLFDEDGNLIELGSLVLNKAGVS